MAQYKFFGSAHAEVYGVAKFVRFGQLVELPDDVATIALSCRLAVLPVKDFDAIFAADDVRKFAQFPSHGQPTDDFTDKLQKAAKLRYSPDTAPTPIAESQEKE